MAKRFVAGVAGVKVSPPGQDVDSLSAYALLFSSERYALSGALRGTFTAGQGQYVGDNLNEVAIALPQGTGAPLYWAWGFSPSTGLPLKIGLPSRHDEATNQLIFTINSSDTTVIHYLIYRNRT